MKKVYITKFAVTAGVLVDKVKVSDQNADEAWWPVRRAYLYRSLCDWATTYEEMISHCNKLRDKAIAFLLQKIERLKHKDFYQLPVGSIDDD